MASSNKSYLSISDLRQIAKSLESERNTLYSTYKNKIVPVLESTSSCFQVAGLDTTEIINSFNSIFNTLNDRLFSLINVLNTNVINNYNDMLLAIREMFNNDCAAKLKDLLSLKEVTLK